MIFRSISEKQAASLEAGKVLKSFTNSLDHQKNRVGMSFFLYYTLSYALLGMAVRLGQGPNLA